MAMTFGEMLLNRRRQMGLSIQQVANTIKMRPQIIEYFETDNFAAMPQRGYAQGMISSYARYLGLNPREVVEAYFDGLHRYERGIGGKGGTLLTPAMSASPRSANANGRYLLAPTQGSRFGQRPPQAGYVSDATPMYGDPSVLDPAATGRLDLRRLPPQSPSGSRDPRMGTAPRDGRRPMSRGAAGDGTDRSPLARRAGTDGRVPVRQGVPRNGAPRGGRPQGRGSVPPRGDNRPRSGGSRPARGGLDFSALLADPRFAMGCLGAIGVLLILVVVLVVRGCTGANAQPSAGSGSAGSAQGTVPLTDLGSTTAGSGSAAADSASGSSATNATPTEYTVVIKYTGDSTAWLEVRQDGQYDKDVGTVTKGFSKTYTVTGTLEISTDKPSDIVVTRDGTRVRYDSKSSGVGRITISVPKQDTATDSSTDGTATSGTSSTDGTATGTTGTSTSTTATATTGDAASSTTGTTASSSPATA